MGVYTHSDGNWLTRRGSFLVALILFHILLFLGLKSGFAVRILESITPPIIAEVIQEVVEDEPPPPPPQVKIEMPPVTVPPVVIDIQMPSDAPTTALSNVTDRPPPPTPPPPPPPPREAVLTRMQLDARRNTADLAEFYPQASMANEEEGVVRIRICVGANGRAKEATVDATSGFPRLDEGGVKFARAARFVPPTVDGKAVDGCGVLPVRFQMPKDR